MQAEDSLNGLLKLILIQENRTKILFSVYGRAPPENILTFFWMDGQCEGSVWEIVDFSLTKI